MKISKCPLCGSEMDQIHIEEGESFELVCGGCGTRFKLWGNDNQSKLDIWNHRETEEMYKKMLSEELDYQQKLEEALKAAGVEVPRRENERVPKK